MSGIMHQNFKIHTFLVSLNSFFVTLIVSWISWKMLLPLILSGKSPKVTFFALVFSKLEQLCCAVKISEKYSLSQLQFLCSLPANGWISEK